MLSEVSVGTFTMNWVLDLIKFSNKVLVQMNSSLVNWKAKTVRFLLEKFDRGTSKEMCYIVAGNESWTKLIKVIQSKITNKKIIAALFRKTKHIVILSEPINCHCRLVYLSSISAIFLINCCVIDQNLGCAVFYFIMLI